MSASHKPELGTKYKCFKCECKFYDLGRPEPLCPRCGADQREDPSPDPREAYTSPRRRGTKKTTKKKKKKVEQPVEEEGNLLDDDETPAKTTAS